MDQWLAILTPILTVTTAIAATVAGITYSVTRTLRANNGDLKDRVEILENGIATRDQQIAKQATQIAECGTEIETLKSMVHQRVEWVAVSDLLEQHHTEANQHWETTEGYLERIAGHMEGGKS